MAKNEIVGEVILDEDELSGSELNDDHTESLLEALRAMWEAYLQMDTETYGGFVAEQARRMSGRNRTLSDNRREILANLPAEWEAFERPDNRISEQITLRWLDIWADDADEPTFAVVSYWVEVEGGVRWHYDDQGAMLQVFAKRGETWQMVHQIDGWATDYDLDEETCGENPTFIFDYVYPVENLQRAIDFYSPILGAPDAVTSTQAIFSMRDPAFILDSSGLLGYASVKQGLPNGYARLYVDDLSDYTQKLKKKKVEFLENTDESPQDMDGDTFALIKDSEGNVVALVERCFEQASGAPRVQGFQGDSPYLQTAKAIAEAWMSKDSETLVDLHADGVWLDISRVLTQGMHYESEGLAEALEAHYWQGLDYSEEGIVGTWTGKNFREVEVGDYVLVSYERTLVGEGKHPFRSQSFVTHLFGGEDDVSFTFINNATHSNGMAIELDYTGHPAEDLERARKFYEAQMALGEPYDDESWYGFWSNNVVYGIFEASPEDDQIPQDSRTNGYLSLWVQSAKDTYAYLQEQGVDFPTNSAINEKKGIDTQPGYVQAVSTDSEGNLIIFTEYTGRRK